jgi:hypothetical protein
MYIINITHKGRLMNTIEKFHIYCAQKEDIHMNEIIFDTHNPIFDAIYEHQKKRIVVKQKST